MMYQNLPPCPYCDNAVKPERHWASGLWAVFCPSCGAAGPMAGGKPQAVISYFQMHPKRSQSLRPVAALALSALTLAGCVTDNQVALAEAQAAIEQAKGTQQLAAGLSASASMNGLAVLVLVLALVVVVLYFLIIRPERERQERMKAQAQKPPVFVRSQRPAAPRLPQQPSSALALLDDEGGEEEGLDIDEIIGLMMVRKMMGKRKAKVSARLLCRRSSGTKSNPDFHSFCSPAFVRVWLCY